MPTPGRRAGVKRTPFVIPLLFLGFVLPFYFDVAGLEIGTYRLVLLIFIIPAMVRWLDGSGGFYAPDYMMLIYALWGSLALLYNHGFARWEFIGIVIVETLGPYFIARWMIRDADAFRTFAVWMFILILFMLPFSIYQSLMDKSLILDFFAKIGKVAKVVYDEPRLGLYRAQGSMPHPILFGIFCSVGFSLTWYVLGYNKNLGHKIPRIGVVLAATFTSLSSGAWLSVAVQIALMLWKVVFNAIRIKWNLLLYLFAGFYLLVDIVATRPPVQLFAAYMTLNSRSAWYRIHIFNNASDDVLNNPIFGIGINPFSRPAWMVGSLDNFWMVVALRYGLPALILLVAILVVIYVKVGRVQLSGRLASYRLGYFFALTGFSIAAISVHLWEATFCLLMFMLGAGLWMLNAEDDADQPAAGDRGGRPRKIRYTRFGPQETQPDQKAQSIAPRARKTVLGKIDACQHSQKRS
ncbi:O-antigen ligase family protein [Ruegeria sp.]|uniref:O-antigen ligase family protein n=1 Tax=Ruegeria sp. TaxID=1879320 RepID=UPI003B59EA1E